MNIWIGIHLLVAVSFGMWFVLKPALRPSQALRLTHLFLIAVFAIPVAMSFFPKPSFIRPSVQIWSASSIRAHRFKQVDAPSVSFSSLSGTSQHDLSAIQKILLILLVTGAVITALRTLRGVWKLKQILDTSYTVRHLGRVRVAVSEVSVPFSFWVPGRAHVIVPYEFLNDLSNYRLALRHELQHHRQRDTVWVHVIAAMKSVLFWNPLFHFWEQGIATLQEFACDEALVDLKQVSPHAYGSCLLKAASMSLNAHRLPVGTTAMAVGSSGQILKRRIDMMFDRKKGSRTNKMMGLMAGTVALAILASVGYASQNLVGDRRISLTDAQQMAKVAMQGSHFPVVVNQEVVDQLNRLLGTPDGRDFVRSSMARMKNYRPMIEGKLQSYSLPEELLAIPLIESGYENSAHTHAAGLWQFIASTARHYNLVVSDTRDDRLNVEAETDAGLRYLSANYLRFQDWQLAIMAYNAGEDSVQRGIDSTGTRDAWQLISSGFENDHGYLAKFMAAVLIIRNPSALN